VPGLGGGEGGSKAQRHGGPYTYWSVRTVKASRGGVFVSSWWENTAAKGGVQVVATSDANRTELHALVKSQDVV
jgi:hypothetical protein